MSDYKIVNIMHNWVDYYDKIVKTIHNWCEYCIEFDKPRIIDFLLVAWWGWGPRWWWGWAWGVIQCSSLCVEKWCYDLVIWSWGAWAIPEWNNWWDSCFWADYVAIWWWGWWAYQ